MEINDAAVKADSGDSDSYVSSVSSSCFDSFPGMFDGPIKKVAFNHICPK